MKKAKQVFSRISTSAVYLILAVACGKTNPNAGMVKKAATGNPPQGKPVVGAMPTFSSTAIKVGMTLDWKEIHDGSCKRGVIQEISDAKIRFDLFDLPDCKTANTQKYVQFYFNPKGGALLGAYKVNDGERGTLLTSLKSITLWIQADLTKGRWWTTVVGWPNQTPIPVFFNARVTSRYIYNPDSPWQGFAAQWESQRYNGEVKTYLLTQTTLPTADQ